MSSSVLRRLPRLASRAVEAATSAPAMRAAAATAAGAPAFCVPAVSFAASQGLLLQQSFWTCSRLDYAAAAEPEGLAGTDVATGEATNPLSAAGVEAGDASQDASPTQHTTEASTEAGFGDASAGHEPAAAADQGYSADQGSELGRDFPREPNPAKIFVSNIPNTIDEQELADHFSWLGELVYVRIYRQEDGPKAFAFVEFASPDAAAAAIEQLSGSRLHGRTLHIRADRGRQPRTDRREGEGTGLRPRRPQHRQRSDRPSVRVVVHGLPWAMQWQGLRELAQKVLAEGGSDPTGLWRADVRTNPDKTSRGWGMLHVATQEAADMLVQALHGMEVDGRTLTAKLDQLTQAQRSQQGEQAPPGDVAQQQYGQEA